MDTETNIIISLTKQSKTAVDVPCGGRKMSPHTYP